MRDDPVNRADPTGRDGLVITWEGWTVGDQDIATGEPLPPTYRSAGFAIGFDDDGNLEIGMVRSNAQGEDDVSGFGTGTFLGVGVYRGEIEDQESTTHTGIAAGGILSIGGSARIEDGEVSTDVGSVGIPVERAAVGIGMGGAVATPTTEADAVDVGTREQLERVGPAISRPID